MSHASDAMLSRLQTEIEERREFQNQLVESAQSDSRDLTDQELELYTRAADRMRELERQADPLRESSRIAVDSSRRIAELQTAYASARGEPAAPTVEYRSAGAYIADRWQAGAGVEAAMRRIETYERAAAHQTTPDNLGVIPEPVVGSVVQFVDAARPVTTALGPQAAPSGMFKRPKVTQHTDAGPQATEKTELVSQKMLISSIPVTMTTIGGYVNVSRQNIDWSSPNILDLVVNDLAAQYAITTEQATCADIEGSAGPTLTTPITGASTADQVAKGLWEAAGLAYAAMKGTGRLFVAVAPDMLGVFGALFAPVNPQNAQSAGFSAGSFSSGTMGSIAGIPVVMSPGLTAGQAFVVNTAAEEVFEQRVGTLQVTEPSVLGVQVAYAGYFAAVTIDSGGIVKLTGP
jgi:HK97 family phage major capsid protein